MVKRTEKIEEKYLNYIAIILQDLPPLVAKVLNCVFFEPLIQII